VFSPAAGTLPALGTPSSSPPQPPTPIAASAIATVTASALARLLAIGQI
jgi:hypothetical protein